MNKIPPELKIFFFLNDSSSYITEPIWLKLDRHEIAKTVLL